MDTKRVNMTWDGFFHALTWVITLGGILQLQRAAYARAPIPYTHSEYHRTGSPFYRFLGNVGHCLLLCQPEG
jgi:uncharacterized membrane protein